MIVAQGQTSGVDLSATTQSVKTDQVAGRTAVVIQDISASLPTNSNLPPYPRRSLSAIQQIILHHTVTPSTFTPQRIAEIVVDNLNRPGISYHYCITSRGEVFQTQPLEVASRHAGDKSVDSIGVALIGNFTEEIPPPAQLEATASLLKDLLSSFNLPLEAVLGRREIEATESPGGHLADLETHPFEPTPRLYGATSKTSPPLYVPHDPPRDLVFSF